MSFNIEEFKKALEPFGGDLIYIDNTPIEGQNDCLQFVVYNVNYLYALYNFDINEEQNEILEFNVYNINYLYTLSNFGEFCKTQILPYYTKLIVLSMNKKTLKGAFIKS